MALAFVLLCSGRADAEISLVGVVVNAAEPERSIAIIDGRMLNPGDMVSGLRLSEVRVDSVLLVDDGTGQAYRLNLARDEATAKETAAATQSGPTRADAGPSSAERAARGAIANDSLLKKLNPLKTVWAANSTMAQASLRQIHNAQEMYAIQDPDRDGKDHYARTILELAEHKLVQSDLSDGEKFGYAFELRAWEDKSGPHYEVFATPTAGGDEQPYLYINENGVIRGQLYGRAGYDSPPYEGGLF